MGEDDRFSTRLGYSPPTPEVSVREAASDELRRAVLHFAVDAGLSPHAGRAILLRLLDVPPQPELWHSESNVLQECQAHLASAQWFEVYDFAELVARHIGQFFPQAAPNFEQRLNRYFERNAIGWRLEDGHIQSRGSEAFQSALVAARTVLATQQLSTARAEIHEALTDLSRRPHPDLTGAIQHAAAALECVAREATGDPKSTLGQILTKYPDILPPPLPGALERIWGYSSEMARHLREGRTPSRVETELVVGLIASVATFLAQKAPQP